MNIILLSVAIILLLCLLLYLTRRKDYQLLKSPPITFPLPRTKYDQALKELNAFKKLPLPKSRSKQLEHNSEQYYLERRLNQILQDTELEQKSYYLACKEREIAWKDYFDFFKLLNVIERHVAPNKIKELLQLRTLFLDAEKTVDFELSKFNARARIRHHEARIKQQRDEEIDRKTRSEITTAEMSENITSIPETDTLKNAFEEIKLSDDSTETHEIDSVPIQQVVLPSATETQVQKQHSSSATSHQFGQADFKEKFPDFHGLTYIDETLSLIDLNLSLVHDANFDRSFFISVLFKDRHQYKDCSFKEADLSYSSWQRASSPHRILTCNFSRAKLKFVQFEFMAFYNCYFNQTDFEGARFRMVKFVNCSFENCNIVNVDFSQTVMSADMLESIDFSSCLNPPKNASSSANFSRQSDENSGIFPSSEESSQ